jgi:flagellar biosynthesis protein FlhF
MNVKRFTARTSRDALALVRQAFGDDAIVMSTRPCADGVEVLAMAPESLAQLERVGSAAPLERAPAPPPAAERSDAAGERRPAAAAVRGALRDRAESRLDLRAELRTEAEGGTRALPATSVEQDVQALAMSTLSFQDYVRERMLRRRQTELAREEAAAPPPERAPVGAAEAPAVHARARVAARGAPVDPPVLRDELATQGMQPAGGTSVPPALAPAPAVPVVTPSLAEPGRRDHQEMLSELRSVRGLIEQRFGALAFMEKLQRQPRQARTTQRLLDCGFSPSLARKLVESLPDDVDEEAWTASVLERNLATGERETALEDQGGVFALVGSTGVGKTTSTAKLAAAFATRHGASQLGLITLDAYRIAAHEQLRTYGRILGVPVHTAHDRASLEDLLELLSGKRMVLIDTAGTAQRDSRTRELLEMLGHRAIRKLLVVNAAAQGETIDDVLAAYGAAACHGVVLSKVDEAVKLAPAVDALIRHKLKLLAVANGQRVPEDWHRLSASALVQRALRGGGSAAWRHDSGEVQLVFAGIGGAAAPASGLHA